MPFPLTLRPSLVGPVHTNWFVLYSLGGDAISFNITVQPGWTSPYKLICSLLTRWRCHFLYHYGPTRWNRSIINWFVLYALGGAHVINELVEIIKEYLLFIVLAKQRHFVDKYEAVALPYDLPSLLIPCKYYIYQTLDLFSFWSNKLII